MFVSSGGSLKSSRGGMAMGELLMLLHCRRIQVRALWRLAPADRDALLRLMPTTPQLEAAVATGQTIWTPPTTSNATADPTRSQGHSSPKITKSGPRSTNLVQPTRRKTGYQGARRLDPSSNRRDPTTPCQIPSVQGSMLTTGSATVMYANLQLLIILFMLARHGHLMDKQQ